MMAIIVTFAIQAMLEPAWHPGVHERIGVATLVVVASLLALRTPLMVWRYRLEIRRTRRR
jgi:hypothetical protein